jgi:hypothetical protein
MNKKIRSAYLPRKVQKHFFNQSNLFSSSLIGRLNRKERKESAKKSKAD